jgi:DNA-binding NtrC family response regulator
MPACLHDPTAPQPSVLVASRDAATARMHRDCLERAGMRVVLASPSALRPGAGVDPEALDVLVVETRALDEARLALIERFRDSAPMVEIVVVSSAPLVDDVVQALRSGAFAILAYPVQDERLVEVVNAACARKRRGEQRIHAIASSDRCRAASHRSSREHPDEAREVSTGAGRRTC